MKRTMIKEVKSSGLFKVSGWLILKNNKTILHDISGEMKIENYEGNISDDMRIAVSFIVEMNNNLCNIKECLFINENRIIEKDINERRALQYLNYLDTENIRLLDQMNLDEYNTQKFLKKQGFYKLYPPLLFTDINEYGVNEWRVVNPITKEIDYYLPQSPEIVTLLLGIGGVEKSYAMSKCFRVDEDDNEKTEASLIEFTQLVVTEAFAGNKEGMELINKYLEYILLNGEYGKFYNLNTITYCDAFKYYGTDKVDYRYKRIYSPIISYNESDYIVLFFNTNIEESVKAKILNIMDKYNIDCKENFYDLDTKSNLSIRKIIFDKAKNLNVNVSSSVLYFENTSENILFANKIKDIIYKIKWKNEIVDYSIIWIVDYPYFKENGTEFDINDINFNIFSNIDNGLKESIKNRENNKDCKCIDLVINGIEIGSGGERLFNKNKFCEMCEALKIQNYEDKYQFYLEILQFGAPFIFTISLGWERLEYVLQKKKPIQLFQTLPKSNSGKNELFKLPKNRGIFE